ncbi:MAG: tyrosine-type recombinase/integrase [Candidatus Thorarchaeota archaeon]
MSKRTLLRKFENSIPAWRSESTRYRYPNLAMSFIDYIGVKDRYTREDAIRFLNAMSRQGKSAGYIRWAAYVLRQFYKSLGLPPPLQPGEMPPESADVNAPVMSADDISKLVSFVRKDGIAATYIALSTTYGMRRTELAKVSSADINNGTILVHTAKGGRPRTHLIPPEIRPYLDVDLRPVNEQTLTNMFSRACTAAGVGNTGYGFHSIRRSLVTELLNAGVPVHMVYDFMRWKISSKLGILGVYARPDPARVDEEVFNKHPFLKLWS